MMAAAAGSAATLAGSAATGRPPGSITNNGATPTWAARVTPTTAARARGRGNASASGSATTTMASDAATDNWKPKTPTRSGSATTSAVTHRARVRTPLAVRPRAHAVAATPAITVARSTDGSKRVITPKSPRTPIVSAHRPTGPHRRSRGATTANTKATFSPETTSRWPSPAPRKSSATAAG